MKKISNKTRIKILFVAIFIWVGSMLFRVIFKDSISRDVNRLIVWIHLIAAVVVFYFMATGVNAGAMDNFNDEDLIRILKKSYCYKPTAKYTFGSVSKEEKKGLLERPTTVASAAYEGATRFRMAGIILNEESIVICALKRNSKELEEIIKVNFNEIEKMKFNNLLYTVSIKLNDGRKYTLTLPKKSRMKVTGLKEKSEYIFNELKNKFH